MSPFKPRKYGKEGPEAIIQREIIAKLKDYDWLVKVLVGNMFQSGLPDIYAAHQKHGQRWIEVKNPTAFSFTAAQQQDFPLFHAKGIGIWILFGDSEAEIMKLFKPANWLEIYLRWVNNVHLKVKG